MPFVQITLKSGHSKETVKAISDSVHESLVSAFGIPVDDKFQTIREVDESHLIFPDSYMGIPHSDKIVFIHVTAKEGRTVDMKKRLFAEMASSVSQNANIAVEDVFVVLVENKAENWSFGCGEAQLA